MGSMVMNPSNFYNFDLTHFVMYLNRKQISSENPTSDPSLKKGFRLKNISIASAFTNRTRVPWFARYVH